MTIFSKIYRDYHKDVFSFNVVLNTADTLRNPLKIFLSNVFHPDYAVIRGRAYFVALFISLQSTTSMLFTKRWRFLTWKFAIFI